jgi:hypothetical protein
MPRRGSGPPKRGRQDTSLTSIHVFVEGSKTEDSYLLPWRREYRDRVRVAVDEFKGAVPMALVRRAVEELKTSQRDAARGKGRAHDEVWCVFDRDEHPQVADALALAAQHGIHVAFSNPCIELWFILHFEEQTAAIDRHAAQRRAEHHLKCRKSLTTDAARALVDRYEDARLRAHALDAKHEGDGSPPNSNPSSGMWRVIDRVRGATS